MSTVDTSAYVRCARGVIGSSWTSEMAYRIQSFVLSHCYWWSVAFRFQHSRSRWIQTNIFTKRIIFIISMHLLRDVSKSTAAQRTCAFRCERSRNTMSAGIQSAINIRIHLRSMSCLISAFSCLAYSVFICLFPIEQTYLFRVSLSIKIRTSQLI